MLLNDFHLILSFAKKKWFHYHVQRLDTSITKDIFISSIPWHLFVSMHYICFIMLVHVFSVDMGGQGTVICYHRILIGLLICWLSPSYEILVFLGCGYDDDDDDKSNNDHDRDHGHDHHAVYFHQEAIQWSKMLVSWSYHSLHKAINMYRQVSNMRRTLVGNEIVDHSDVVGASLY